MAVAECARPRAQRLSSSEQRPRIIHALYFHVAAPGDGRTPSLSNGSSVILLARVNSKYLPAPPYNPGLRDLVARKRAGSFLDPMLVGNFHRLLGADLPSEPPRPA